jgi:hypothetical protein
VIFLEIAEKPFKILKRLRHKAFLVFLSKTGFVHTVQISISFSVQLLQKTQLTFAEKAVMLYASQA